MSALTTHTVTNSEKKEKEKKRTKNLRQDIKSQTKAKNKIT
jgi:hypothetical protein